MNVAISPKAWSHSALTSFETCPKRYWHLNVAKDFKETRGEQVVWGEQVHKAIENRLKHGVELPLGMKQFESLVAPLAAIPGTPLVEQKLALDAEMNPSGWFGQNVWVRVVVDAAFINYPRAMLIDWKTGRRKEDDDQLALMAGVMFAQDSELEIIDSAFVWLQEKAADAVAKSTFTRGDVPQIWDRFLRRVEAFQEAHQTVDFPATPCNLCRRYCPVKSCPYNGAS